MEQQHLQNMAQNTKYPPTLPTVLTGTITERDSPYTTHPPMGLQGKPDEVNKELLEKLRQGMAGLSHLREPQTAENFDPNVQLLAQSNLNAMRAAHPSLAGPSLNLHQTDGINYDTQSITSNRYN